MLFKSLLYALVIGQYLINKEWKDSLNNITSVVIESQIGIFATTIMHSLITSFLMKLNHDPAMVHFKI